MRLRKLLEAKRAKKETSLVVYLTAGDPTSELSLRYLKAVIEEGADIVELGVPHTDPVADGPTNAKAAERALKSGGGLRSTFAIAKKLREAGIQTPLVLFTYYNPICRMGLSEFAAAAEAHGIDGALVVDLPPEESQSYRRELGKHHLDTIFLASPTTPNERLQVIEEASTGFVYYVSRSGVTGAGNTLSDSLDGELANVRARIKKPLFVGFGISSKEHVERLSSLVDGVVVGSALVKCIENGKTADAAEKSLRELTKQLASGLRKKED